MERFGNVFYLIKERGKKKEKQVRSANKKKGRKGQRAKPPTPIRATDMLIGEEEQKEIWIRAEGETTHPN